jgi:hypothetical protein
MKKVVKPNLNKRRTMLFYGDSGTGKTVLASTAQLHDNYKNVFMIDGEGGYSSIASYMGDKAKDMLIYPVDTLAYLEEVAEWLMKREQAQRYYKEAKKPEEKKRYRDILIEQEQAIRDDVTEPTIINTIVLDSLSRFQQMAMAEIVGDNSTLDTTRFKKASFDHWGKNKKVLRNLVNIMFNLPNYNLIFLALSNVKEINGEEKIVPFLEGNYVREVGANFDIVGYYEKSYDRKAKEDVRILYWDNANAITKNRFSDGNSQKDENKFMVNPTIEKIEKFIGGK